MDLPKLLDDLEDKYGPGEPEENKAALIQELYDIHMQTISDEDLLNRFTVLASERFGGVYIPYLFWVKLSDYYEYELDRSYLFTLLKAFANSNFSIEEQKMMKALIIIYFAREKEFEINKYFTLHMSDIHPNVKEYFQKLLQFVEKNKKSTDMYCEKFEILKDVQPDFDLMNTPLSKLKQQAGI